MKSKWSNSNVLSHILVAVVVMASNLVIMGAHGDPLVPCYFIFGDSIVDNGNNNFLPTISKADYFPYGIDFPYGPTGRFTNGRTIADIITEYLGFNGFIQPFASANDLDLHSGVNYASASAGILGETGSITGDVMSLNAQIRNHQNTIMRMSWTFGRGYTRRHLNKCLYSVGMGSNDYLANYFQPDYYPSSKKYTLEQFTDLLIGEHTEQLKDLYVDGARKIVVFGLGKMGCIPLLINAAGRNSSDCVEAVNNAAQLFNSKLVPIIDQLNYIYSDAKFIYINNYKLGDDAHDMSGLEVETIGCCPAGSDGRCVPGGVPCEDRSRYMFWDAIHPSEALNTYYASRSISARFPDDSYPFDINTLVSLRQDVAAAE